MPGIDGSDGFSPTIDVSRENDKTVLTITDVNGTNTVEIPNGKQGPAGADGAPGADGRDGADGVSPTVELMKENGVTTMTVTDAAGTHSTEIADGADGVSPVVQLARSDVEKKTTLTITDAEGVKTADIPDGAPGPRGEQGVPGYPPKLSDTGTWMVWDTETGAYTDTGVKAFYGDNMPATGVEDAGKVLTVTEAGVPGWADSGLADKLPKSPTDWEPWTTEEQAAARERIGIPGNYELIEEINLEEDTTIIERNTDLQGNAYNLKAIRILYEIAEGAGVGYIRTRLQENNEANGSFIPYGTAIDTTKKVSICGCELVNGFPVSFGLYRASAITGGAVQGAYSPSCYFPTRGEAVNAINSLYINSSTSGVPIPSGSKIKIYGVRA